MPKIEPEFFKHVFFLFRIHPKTGKLDGPCGAGAIVVRDSEHVPGHDHYYAVSNHHVVAGNTGASIIRLNTHDGKSRTLEYDPSEWTQARHGDDLCAIDITDKVSLKSDDARCFDEKIFADENFLRTHHIGPGDDVFMLGLFASHHGGERNIPVARFGNLSMMATAEAPVPQEFGPPRPYHLADMRSRTGFSGSPVYVFRTPAMDLTAANSGKWSVNVKDNLFVRFLGVHCGQFREPIDVQKKPVDLEALGRAIMEGDQLVIPSSMTIIVPAWRVSELMDHPKFKEQRRLRDERNAAKAQSSHQERFNRLLGAAVKPPKSTDQT